MFRSTSFYLKTAASYSIVFFLYFSAMAGKDQGVQVSHHVKIKTDKKEQVGFWLYLPEDFEKNGAVKFPLLVFLHGSGERGDDLEKVKVHGPPKLIDEGKKFPFVVLSPQCPKEQWWDTELIFKLVQKIVKKYKIDHRRIYLTGLSMGGYGTWDLTFEHPDYFAAAIPICGGGQANYVRPSNKKFIENIKNLPYWVFHGAEDRAVDLKESEEMVDALKSIGGDVKFTVYPEAGHDSWTETYENEAVYQWMLEHRNVNMR